MPVAIFMTGELAFPALVCFGSRGVMSRGDCFGISEEYIWEMKHDLGARI
jgi:hypothetical protein